MRTVRNVWPILVLSLVLAGCGKDRSATDKGGQGVELHGEQAHTAGEAPEEPEHKDHSGHEARKGADSARDGHGHAEEGHEQEEASGAEFQEGKGILLAQSAREMIGLETAEVSQRTLALAFTATARVFHAAHQHGSEFPGHKDGHAYANAIIPTATADLLKVGQAVVLNRYNQHWYTQAACKMASFSRSVTAWVISGV